VQHQLKFRSVPGNSERDQIVDQLRRVYEGPAWLGPSLKALLADVNETRARERTVAGAHTIWELVLHLAAWLRIARERLTATKTRDANDAENWPEMKGTWQEALTSLEQEERALEHAVRAFPEDRLQDTAPASEPQTYYVLLHGSIQHAAYHAGQIALLKK